MHRARAIAESFGVDADRSDPARPRYPHELVAVAAAPGTGEAVDALGGGFSMRYGTLGAHRSSLTAPGPSTLARRVERAHAEGMPSDSTLKPAATGVAGPPPPVEHSAVPRLGRSLVVFLGVTFGFTWLTASPLVLSAPATVLPWYFSAGSAGPALGAIAATLVMRPEGGLRGWASRTFSVRGAGWALIVVVASVALYFGAGLLVEQLTTGSLDRLSALGLTTKLPGMSVIVVLLIWLLTGGLGEETGWRGWLMPALTQRFGFTAAALIVAVVWMLWHAPQFLFNPGFRGMGWATIGWGLALIAGSFWLGWLARLGRWSILPVVLWHGGFDLLTSSDLGPAAFPATVSTLVIVQAVAVVIVLAVRRARRSVA